VVRFLRGLLHWDSTRYHVDVVNRATRLIAIAAAIFAVAACKGSQGEEPEPMVPPGLAFRSLPRSFAVFDVPVATDNGWRIEIDGQRQNHAAALVVPPDDAPFQMSRALAGRGPLTLRVDAFLTDAPAKALFDDELARARGGGGQPTVTQIAGVKALKDHREHSNVDLYEEQITAFFDHTMVRWRVSGPRSEQPTIRAISYRLERSSRSR